MHKKDFYSQYTNDDLWHIKEDGFDPEIQNIREAQFSIGNGLIGARGVLEESPKGAVPGTYMSGIYDRMTSQVAELVNLPNPFHFKFTLKGEKFGAVTMDTLEHHRVLNLQHGLLIRKTIYSDIKKRRYNYQSIRFLSMDNKNIGVMQLVLTPLDDDADIELQTVIDVSVHNAETMTEGTKRHFHTIEMRPYDHTNYMVVETLEKHQKIVYHSGFYYKIGRNKKFSSSRVLSLKLKKGQPAVFTKVFYISSCGDKESDLKKEKKRSTTIFQRTFKTPFSKLLKNHIDAWEKLWKTSDIVIEGTAEIQKNVRFNIYHMLICSHFDNGYSSIGARTLSGEGYRGHIFWDAEIFLLPFYAYTNPEIAKNMLLYRYKRLDHARKIAISRGYKGAMFPWESAGTGEEETPTWAKNLDGTIIRIKTNELEHHISADIAYACCQYVEIANDLDFLRKYGYEILLETARFWASRVKHNRQGHFEIRDVIGPDEFHEHVNNNAFTNMMAKWNLLTAHNMFLELKKKGPKTFKALKTKLNFSDKEVAHWKSIGTHIVLKKRKDNVIEQFDSYFRKRYVKITDFDENSIPLLPKGIRVKDYQTTQFVKQSDVLMLLYLLSDQFDKKTKEKNFWFYHERTLHKSSLSAAIHSIIALEAGALNLAYQFFNVALHADISNLHGNTAEGTHAASLGGVWQNIIHGFAGVKMTKDGLSIDPKMPTTWRSIKFTLHWKGNLLRIETKNNEVFLQNDSKKKKVNVTVFGHQHELSGTKKYLFQKNKITKQEGYY
ncbi:MAG: Kojibiose phosphorylase [Chlamydiae bacterium]|nr:Kojibiose phosphorylase [Chlamydiota bacterium]